MLHCNHEASTGWTRNSWLGSRTKKSCLSAGAAGVSVHELGTGERRRSRIYHSVANGRANSPPARDLRATEARLTRARELTWQLLAATIRTQLSTPDASPIARPGGPSRVSVSEFAFLAFGLMVGVAAGAAVIVFSTGRPAAVNEIRLTVTPNAIPARRRSTLSEDAFPDHSEPARGGPAERLEDDPKGRRAWPLASLETRTVVRSGPRPPAGAGDPESSASVPRRSPVSNPWPVAVTNRAALPASSVASYLPSITIRPRVAVPIFAESDLEIAALRESIARTAENLMREQRQSATATLERPREAFEPLSAVALAASTRRRSSTAAANREGNGTAAPGPCDEAERVADERCSVAARASEQADIAEAAVRQVQRTYDERGALTERAAIAADPGGMRVAKETAQHAFRRARAGATTRQAIEAAAQMWLTEINRINQGARDAAVQVERERQAAEQLVATLERLTVDADAARAAADAAAATCEAARAAVAECHDALPGTPHPRVPPITPFPSAAIWHPLVTSPDDDAALDATFAAPFAATGANNGNGTNESAIIRLLRGDRATLDRLGRQRTGP